jgi:hypothetical protein
MKHTLLGRRERAPGRAVCMGWAPDRRDSRAPRLLSAGVLAIACCRVSHAKSTAPKCTAQSLASDIWLFWAVSGDHLPGQGWECTGRDRHACRLTVPPVAHATGPLPLAAPLQPPSPRQPPCTAPSHTPEAAWKPCALACALQKWSVNGGTKPPMTPALFGCPNSSKAWKAALVIVAPKSQKPGSGSPAYKQEKALPEGCRCVERLGRATRSTPACAAQAGCRGASQPQPGTRASASRLTQSSTPN